jgi:hypothetical protein
MSSPSPITLNTTSITRELAGVAAALTSVLAPQIRDASNDAAADATLAIISVCSEIRPPNRFSLRSAQGS